MAIPNTTPTPNELYNGEMKKMGDTELRVVLVVTRATLGWQLDPNTGTRKKEDWISRKQIMDKTGRSGRAVSSAIQTCIEKGWIEARDKKGKKLNNPKNRSGKKIYYRLGEIFLKKIEQKEKEEAKQTSEKSSQVDRTSEKFAGEKSSGEKSSLYKRNSNTKENDIQKSITIKDSKESEDSSPVNQIFDLFYENVNPGINYGNKTTRKAAKWLIDKYGLEVAKKLTKYAISVQGEKYAPTITTPYQLKENLGKLKVYRDKENKNKIPTV